MKKRIPLFITALIVPFLASSSSIPMKAETIIGADFSNGVYAYQLSDRFYEAPNTIEAWVRLGKVSTWEPGGVIFGNSSNANLKGITLEVNENKNLVLNWNSKEVRVTFDNYTLERDTWAHVSVVRDAEEGSFTLYVNGLLKQKLYTSVGTNPLSTWKFCVGSDNRCWTENKNTFRGEILQVTAYSDARTSHEVYEDYIDGGNISYETRDNLLFNGEFSFNCLGATDTSRYANHAVKKSVDYFFDGDLYEAKDYSFSIIPDPQIMTHHRRDLVDTISEYLIDVKDEQKMALTMCVGDNADATGFYVDGAWDLELGAISDEFDALQKAGIRWTTIPGNHDYDNNCTIDKSLTNYNRYFSHDRIKQHSWYGGVYKDGQTQNSYYLFEEVGVKYLVVCLEFGPDDDVLNWANEVVASYPDRRVIVTTHGYLAGDADFLYPDRNHSPVKYAFSKNVGVNSSDQIYEKFIRKHKNIFMVFCGHIPYDDIAMREDVGDNGNVIMSFLIDAQGLMMTTTESLLGMFAFDELNQRISVNYVSSITRKLYNIQNQFVYSFKGYTDILSSVYYDENGELRPEYQEEAK